jgi:hypothetical protein
LFRLACRCLLKSNHSAAVTFLELFQGTKMDSGFHEYCCGILCSMASDRVAEIRMHAVKGMTLLPSLNAACSEALSGCIDDQDVQVRSSLR